ncbi:hypothetical protein PROFUN_16976, partial [Planoprotostelium fungivorum]
KQPAVVTLLYHSTGSKDLRVLARDHSRLVRVLQPDSNQERKGQTLKQEAGLYRSAIGAPDMHLQNSQVDPKIFISFSILMPKPRLSVDSGKRAIDNRYCPQEN